MGTAIQKLPLGIHSFSNLREDGCIYVDKTEQLLSLIDRYKVCFLARPRRFGKSLLVSTLKSLFMGERKYFSGLAADKLFDSSDYLQRHVISLDMTPISIKLGVETMNKQLVGLVNSCALMNGVSIKSDIASVALGELIDNMFLKSKQRLVVLLDEFDRPILEFIDNPKIANEARELLQNFYSQLKAKSEYIYFLFVTGISNFTKSGLFSLFNHLTDISLKPEFSDICGYTQQELETYFSPLINTVAQSLGISYEELIYKIKSYYDGFSFDGEHRVYNPYSVISFLDAKSFGNFWYNTSTPTFLEKYLANKKINFEQFIGTTVSHDDIANPREIENSDPAIFLYQAGCLTLKGRLKYDCYVLDYPNQEVIKSMSRLISLNYFANIQVGRDLNVGLVSYLEHDDFDAFLQELNLVLEEIGHDTYRDLESVKGIKHENVYRDLFALFMLGTYAIDVSREVFGSRGRSDIVAKIQNKVTVLELKVAYENDDPIKKLHEAESQMLERRYANRHFFTADVVTAVAIVITHAQRKITHHSVRRMRKENLLASQDVTDAIP